jgi:hypothetical protein
MKNVILIHAHVNVDQLNLLIDQLVDDRHSIYVNLDRKCAIDPQSVHTAATVLKSRAAVIWGDYSQVEQTLNSMKEIAAAERGFGHLVFLSGQDFPIASNDQIAGFLGRNRDRDLIHHEPIGAHPWADRFEYHHYHGANRVIRKLFRVRRRLMEALGLKRSMVDGLEPYGGSQWWMLTEATVRHTLEFVARNPQYVRFMRTVHCADEMFFQTLLLNSPRRDHAVNDYRRYIDWSTGDGVVRWRPPKELTESDFDKVVASNALFCRKVVQPQSEGLIRKLIELRAAARDTDLMQDVQAA